MCTLIVSVGQWPSAPLIVAANRDELRGRPASGPRWWPGEPFFAPRDEQAGGTWLGVTRSGMFVGVTNRFRAQTHPERESRGQLVVEALRATSPSALQAQLATLSPERFNAFHLLSTDGVEAFVTWSDGARVQQQSLGRGLHVVTERSLGGDDKARAELARETWARSAANGPPSPNALHAMLGTTHPTEPVGGLCVDLPEFGYGTRSSMVYFGGAGTTPRLWWADGRPDRTPFVELDLAPTSVAGLPADVATKG